MPSPEQLPLQDMQEVNWDRMTEEQAAGFGLSLSLFNDAVEQHELARTAALARTGSLVIAAIVGLTMLSWTDPKAAVFGMLGSLVLGAGVSWWHTRRTAKEVKTALAALQGDITQLPRG